MRSAHFGRMLTPRIDGIRAVTDNGVLAYWQTVSHVSAFERPVYAGQYYGLEGRPPSRATFRYAAADQVTPCTTVGGRLYVFPEQGVVPWGNPQGVTAEYGVRYANVRNVAVLNSRDVARPRIILMEEAFRGRVGVDRFKRHLTASIRFDWGAKNGLRWSLPEPDRSMTTAIAIKGNGLSHLVEFYEDAILAGPVPGNLLTVTREETGFYTLCRRGVVQYWHAVDDGTPPMRRGELAPPADLRHPAPADLAVSPDGSKLFVAWAGKGVDRGHRGCATSIYDAQSFAHLVTYNFPAMRLAPSPDGLTLWIADSAEKGQELTLTQIDLD